MKLEAARETAFSGGHHPPLQLLTLRVTRQKIITSILRKPPLSPTTVPTPPQAPVPPDPTSHPGQAAEGYAERLQKAAPQGLRTHSEAQPGRPRARWDAASRSTPISRGSENPVGWDGVGLRTWEGHRSNHPTRTHQAAPPSPRVSARAPGKPTRAVQSGLRVTKSRALLQPSPTHAPTRGRTDRLAPN